MTYLLQDTHRISGRRTGYIFVYGYWARKGFEVKLYVSDQVRCEEIQGCLVVLDLQSAAYFILDPVGTFMWKALLATEDDAAVLQTLGSEYAANPARLKADLAVFSRHCREHGFLEENEPGPGVEVPTRIDTGPGRFLTVRAWWCLFRTARLLSVNGLARTYREYCCLPIPEESFRNADILLQRSVAAFAWAENFFLMKRAPQDCLARSLALFRFLRSAGLAVEHFIGVQRFPFQAHAWVEYRGRVVNDEPSWASTFKTLARISA